MKSLLKGNIRNNQLINFYNKTLLEAVNEIYPSRNKEKNL